MVHEDGVLLRRRFALGAVHDYDLAPAAVPYRPQLACQREARATPAAQIHALHGVDQGIDRGRTTAPGQPGERAVQVEMLVEPDRRASGRGREQLGATPVTSRWPSSACRPTRASAGRPALAGSTRRRPTRTWSLRERGDVPSYTA